VGRNEIGSCSTGIEREKKTRIHVYVKLKLVMKGNIKKAYKLLTFLGWLHVRKTNFRFECPVEY